MKDEIKEIERILATSGKYITYAERCYVLDYITNLQEKYEEADNDRRKLFEQKEKVVEYINKQEDYFVNYPLVNRKYILNILNSGDKE